MSIFFYKYFIRLVCILFFAGWTISPSGAQYVHTFDESNSGIYIKSPYNHDYKYSWSKIIDPPDILDEIKGSILAVGFNANLGTGGPGIDIPTSNQKIYMRTMGSQYFTSPDNPDTSFFTRVYHGDVWWKNYDWKDITLDVPFDYQNNSLVILWHDHHGTADTDYNMTFDGLRNHSVNAICKGYDNNAFPTGDGELQMSIPNIRITFEEETDIGIASVISPDKPIIPESDNPLQIVFKNYRPDSIISAEINWSIDGVLQPAFNWSGMMLYNDTSDTINLGNINLPKGDYELKVWTSNPNGKADEDNSNDTLTQVLVCNYDVVSGDPTLTNDIIPVSRKKYSWASVVYTPEEIGGAGEITHLAFYSNRGDILRPNQKIYLSYAEKAQFTSGVYPDLSSSKLVFDGSIYWEEEAWTYIELDSAFEYHGTGNLLVHYENRHNSTYLYNFWFLSTNTSPIYQSKFKHADNAFPGDGNPRYEKPVAIFRFAPAYTSDASVRRLIEPVSGTSVGNHDIQVEIANYGSSALTDATISWEFNQSLRPDISWSGSLDFFRKDTIMLDNVLFGAGLNRIKTWIHTLNTGTDTIIANDTLDKEVVFCNGPLGGVYDIPADIGSLYEAIEQIKVCGIDSAVTLNLAPGTHHGPIDIVDIPGISNSDTLLITSATEDRNDVILTSMHPEYTVRMERARHIAISNITLRNDSSGVPVQVKHCDSILILNNYFLSDTNLSPLIAITDSISDIVVSGNRFEEGSEGISVQTNTGANMQISNNSFVGEKAANILKVNNLSLENNTVNCQKGFTIDQCNNISVIKNRITANENPLTLWSVSTTGNQTNLVANNFIQSGNQFYSSLRIMSGKNVCLYHNTIISDNRPVYISQTDSLDVKNNIFQNSGYSGYIYTISASDINASWDIENNSYFFGTAFADDISFTEWQDTYGFDLNTDTLRVWFLEDSVSTLHYIVNNKGVVLNDVTDDLFGTSRDTLNPDIGAVEFDGCDTPMRGVYTIDKDGDGDFRSFGQTLSALKWCTIDSTVHVRVNPDTYNEQLCISDSISGISANNKLVFESADADSNPVILTWEADTALSNYVVEIRNVDHITLRGLTLKPIDSTYNTALALVDEVSHCVFENNFFKGPGISDGDWRNTLVYVGKDHADYFNQTNNVFYGNVFENNLYAFVKDPNDDFVTTSHFVFDSNWFHGQYKYGLYGNRCDSLILKGNKFDNQEVEQNFYYVYLYLSGGYIIEQNDFSGSEFKGKGALLVRNSDNGTLKNNIFNIDYNRPKYDYNGELIYLRSINLATILNNTIHADYNPESKSADLLVSDYVDELALLNNIFSNETAEGYIYKLNQYSDLVLNSDHNAFYNHNIPFKLTGQDYQDLMAWSDSLGQDSHSFFIKPHFLSDTRLQTFNPLLNGTGLSLAEVSIDFDGVPRDTVNPDIGAFEFDSSVYSLNKDILHICIYDTILLDAGAYYDTYQWYPDGINNRFLQVSKDDLPGDSAWFRAEVELGGEAYTDSLQVIISRPIADIGEDLDTCKYSYITLENNSSDSGYSYFWEIKNSGDWDESPYDYDSMRVTYYTFSDIYQVRLTVTDRHGCIAMDSVRISQQYEAPFRPSIYKINDSLYTDTDATSYRWFLNGETYPGSTNTIIPEQGGDYRVVAYDLMCPSDTSLPYHIMSVGEYRLLENIKVYPNPATESVVITMDVDFPDKNGRTIRLMDMSGNILQQQVIGGDICYVHLSEYPAGMYFIIVEVSGKRWYKEIVVQ